MNIRDFLKGHILLFDKINFEYEKKYRNRLIYSFLLLGIVTIPAIQQISKYLDINQFEWSNTASILSMLVLFILVMKFILDFKFRTLGLNSWKQWPLVQKLYFLQVVPIAIVVFSLLFKNHLENLIESYNGVSGFIFFSMIPGIIWGIIQEFVYRGMLQNELVRRFGAFSGIMVSNLIFTFGPLHFYYFNIGSTSPIQWMMFLSIFGIGFLFGVLYHRSGNLWIPAIFHGLWMLNWQ